MIASVVATLEPGCCVNQVMVELNSVPGIEVGDLVCPSLRVPITIDLPTPVALEDVTRQLQACRGVMLVDVVFVHLEEDPVTPPATTTGNGQQ